LATRDKPVDPANRLGRRDVLQTLATGLAGAVAAPQASAFGPPSPEEKAEKDPHPRLLDDHRLAVLARIGEALVPGSGAAGVPDLLDRLMAFESLEEQTRFLSALGAFEREARERHQKGWLEIEEGDRREILRAASTLAPAQPEPPVWTRGTPVEPGPQGPPPPANLRDHFDRLRDRVARAYYASEPGMRELGFKGRMAWPGFPGCSHSGDDHR
jgi:hypothetical protein